MCEPAAVRQMARHFGRSGSVSVLLRFRERLRGHWRNVFPGAVNGEFPTGTTWGLSSSDGFLLPSLFILMPTSSSALVFAGGAACAIFVRTECHRGGSWRPSPPQPARQSETGIEEHLRAALLTRPPNRPGNAVPFSNRRAPPHRRVLLTRHYGGTGASSSSD